MTDSTALDQATILIQALRIATHAIYSGDNAQVAGWLAIRRFTREDMLAWLHEQPAGRRITIADYLTARGAFNAWVGRKTYWLYNQPRALDLPEWIGQVAEGCYRHGGMRAAEAVTRIASWPNDPNTTYVLHGE